MPSWAQLYLEDLSESANDIRQIADHLFRSEAGRLVAVLTRIFGLHNLDLAEDVVQEAFGKALKDWEHGIPDNPAAWLMQTAKNKAIDVVRRQRYLREFAAENATLLKSEYTVTPVIETLFMENEIEDSQLRMIFACCHPGLAEADQIALTLKTCSGFSVQEVAAALLTNHEAVKKRLQRARSLIVTEGIQFLIPVGSELARRLDIVLHVVYLIFNEGYNSSGKEALIRRDLCEEALRLSLLLTENDFTRRPKCSALVALLSLLASRFDARLDEEGEIILLEDQDRSKWSEELIGIGMQYLDQSTAGEELSEYHVEAAIVSEHSRANSLEETDWRRILSLYDLLALVNSSPMVLLNRAIVVGKVKGAESAIREIRLIPGIESLIGTHYLFSATLGELSRQLKRTQEAKRFLEQSYNLTQSPSEKKLLRRKIDMLS